MSVLQARALGLTNYSILVSHVRVPPAMRAILSSPSNRVQGFLLAGHVCSVMGYHEYPALLEEFRIPMAVTGFEPLDLVRGILKTVKLLEAGKVEIVNAYARGVTFEGNRPAEDTIRRVFEECDRKWRGIGMIPMSGWRLRPDFDAFNAEKKFAVEQIEARGIPSLHCRSDLAGLEETSYLHGFWNGLHAGAPARRHDGFLGGRLRGILSLRAR